MSGKLGGKPLASQDTKLQALRIQSAVEGLSIPLVFGRGRLAAKLIWYGAFQAVPHKSNSKKSAEGKKGQSSGGVTYTYKASAAMLLCRGPIINIGRVWDSRGNLLVIISEVVTTAPVGGGNVTVTPPNSGKFHTDLGVGRSDPYSVTVNDFGSDGSTTYSGNFLKGMGKVASSPGAGQYTFTLSGSNGVYGFSAADGGKTISIKFVFAVPDSSGSPGAPTTQLAVTVFTGQPNQTAWTYLTSTFPGQDLPYPSIAYVAEANADLGSSGALPNFNWEIFGLLPFGNNIQDCNPKDVANFLLTDPLDGVLFNSAWIGDLTQWSNYCVANGLFVSPVYEQQEDCAKLLDDLCLATNTEMVWSQGLLKFRPYGDVTVAGNGAIYIPETTPVYDMNFSDFQGKEDPVRISRTTVIDAENYYTIEFINADNSYNPQPATASIQWAIEAYGLKKKDPIDLHIITTAAVAKFAANILVKRNVFIRNKYEFDGGWQHILAEPMDLVRLTNPQQGLNKTPVRIKKITEDPKGKLTFQAEEFPWGTATGTAFPHPAPGGYIPNGMADPGNVSIPYFFEANDKLSRSGLPELWIAVAGDVLPAMSGVLQTTIFGPNFQPYITVVKVVNGQEVKISPEFHNGFGGRAPSITFPTTEPDTTEWRVYISLTSGQYSTYNSYPPSTVATGAIIALGSISKLLSYYNPSWGGCTVWMSTDAGANYLPIGQIIGGATYGRLTTTMPNTADPDTTDTVNISLYGYNSSLSSFSATDCDKFKSLSLVQGPGDEDNRYELISYQDVTALATNQFAIGTRLRRGVYGTVVQSHTTHVVFVFLDDNVFSLELEPNLVGETLNFKFTSFNTSHQREQSLADVIAWPYLVTGRYGNFRNIVGNDATVDFVGTGGPPFTAATVRVYGKSGGVPTPGTGVTFNRSDGSVYTIAAVPNFTGQALSTTFYAVYSPEDDLVKLYTDWPTVVNLAYFGQIILGQTTTPDSAGSGGDTGGGGGSDGGGGPIPPIVG